MLQVKYISFAEFFGAFCCCFCRIILAVIISNLSRLNYFKWPRDDGRRGLKRLKTPNPGTIFVAAALRHNLLVGINFILIANFRREELLLR